MFLNNLNDQSQQGQGQQTQNSANQGQTIEELRAQLTAVTKNAKNEALAQLLMDPDFAAVARAKHEGRPVKIIPLGQGQNAGNQSQGDGGQSRQEHSAPTKPIDEMTESEKIQYMIAEVAKALKPNLTEAIKPLQQQTERLNSIVTENEGEKIRSRIAKMRQEHPDFDDYREEMVKLIDQHPTLPVEHVFVLAKANSGRLVDKRQINQNMSTFASSERPSTVADRPGSQSGYDPSMNGIRSSVSDTVRELLASNYGPELDRRSQGQGLRV